jgi:hypothetical protein
MTVGRIDLPSPNNTNLSASGVDDPEASSLRHLTITKVSVSFRVIEREGRLTSNVKCWHTLTQERRNIFESIREKADAT